jgi:hypothetical protein
MVASYLGITRETLSRLRKQIAVKKAGSISPVLVAIRQWR